MAWVKVPPENHPLFHAALPDDPRIHTLKMFGGVAAKVNGHIFAGLFGRSTMLQLSEADKAEALALEGAEYFDPMGDGRMRSDKVMLPESMMDDEEGLRGWMMRALRFTVSLPPKVKSAPKPPATRRKKAASASGVPTSREKTAPAEAREPGTKSERPRVAPKRPGPARATAAPKTKRPRVARRPD